MDFCCVSSVILFLFFAVMLRTLYVVKRRKGHGPLDRRKPVKVMVVAGSGTRSINLKPEAGGGGDVGQPTGI